MHAARSKAPGGPYDGTWHQLAQLLCRGGVGGQAVDLKVTGCEPAGWEMSGCRQARRARAPTSFRVAGRRSIEHDRPWQLCVGGARPSRRLGRPPADATPPSASGVFGSNSVAPEVSEPRVARDFQKRHRKWPSVTRPHLGRQSAHLLVI